MLKNKYVYGFNRAIGQKVCIRIATYIEFSMCMAIQSFLKKIEGAKSADKNRCKHLLR